MEKHEGLAATILLFEAFIIFFYAASVSYDSSAAPDSSLYPMYQVNLNSLASRLSPVQDIHIMMFIGFGYLMTFLRKYGYSALGYTLLIAAFATQWSGICVPFFIQAYRHTLGDMNGVLETNTNSLIDANFAAATILISFGAVIGKTTATQLLWMTFIEVVLYSMNLVLVYYVYKATDIGGSMVIHTFGAYFGLAVSWILSPRDIEEREDARENKAVYHADMFAMIGTIFLWCYWPSFNAAFAGLTGDTHGQNRAIVNTTLSLTGSVMSSFAVSALLRHGGKVDMVDIQNATLAGGVAIGAAADLAVTPAGAIAVGLVAGAMSNLAYVKLQGRLLKNFGLHDTCGVHNLHGLPGLLGGVVSAIAVGAVSDSTYGEEMHLIFIARPARTQASQAWVQFGATISTAVIACVCGLVVGLWLRSPAFFHQPASLFRDDLGWEVPAEETPNYFAGSHQHQHQHHVVEVASTHAHKQEAVEMAAAASGPYRPVY